MKTYNINFKQLDKKAEKKTEVTIEGNLTLQNATELKESLVQNIKKYNSFIVVVKNVTGIDLSFYQLIESFKKSVKSKEKQIEITYILPAEQKKLFTNCGIKI